MDTTYTDIQDGKRFDIAVEFVTRRVIDCGEDRVHRLLVSDGSGRQFAVLTTPDSDPPVGLKAGETYRLSGVLGVDPAVSAGDTGSECPSCGGQLRPGQVLDVVGPTVGRAASQLDLEEPFGILDDRATVRPQSGERTPVDDWIPMDVESPIGLPDSVCLSCGRRVSDETGADWHSDRAAAAATEQSTLVGTGATATPATADLAVGGTGTTKARANVARGYTPQPTAFSDERLFSSYHLETGESAGSEGQFTPHCGVAASLNPMTGTTEQYLSVGLDGTFPVEEFERPRLDLVVVLDVSGSMDCPFDVYHYGEQERRAGDEQPTKLEVATRALCALAGKLREDDRLGVVLCNHRAQVAKPLRDVGTTDMDAIRRHVRAVAAGGGTDLASGFETAVDMLDASPQGFESERRVVLASDVVPNAGTTAPEDLADLFATASTRGIHTTFLGVGLDANAHLAATLSEVRGANYWFVRSPAAFERRLDEAFDCMVTPVVYDLTLELDADSEVAAVHGCPSATATGRLVHVGTLFPSVGPHGSVHGGFVLVRLEAASASPLEVVVSWTERGGGEYAESLSIEVPGRPGTYTDGGVRTAVALARYGRELRSWAADRHDRARAAASDDRHERGAVPLAVSRQYARRFDRLRDYLESEMEQVADGTLQREVNLLDALCRQAAETSMGAAD